MRKKHRLLLYFSSWIIITLLFIILNVLNVDWSHTHPVSGVIIVLVLGVLQGSVIEIPLQTVSTLLVGGERRGNRRQDGNHLTIVLNYNLLATGKDDIDECLETMYMAYTGNLSPNVSAVLVSATNDAVLKEYELEVRDKYRRMLHEKLYREGIAFARGEYDSVDNIHSENVWSLYADIESKPFVNDFLESICSKYVDNFMVIHRISRVLKKCGQYQDLMLLSDGHRHAFSYCDPEYYTKLARQAGEPMFQPSDDEQRIFGSKYDYTLVLDGDTGVPRGCVLDLLQIAAAHPDRGIIQPSIKLHCTKSDPIFMHVEAMRQVIYETITNAMTHIFGQSSFFGKGLIKNRLYIDQVIGSKDQLIERVPVDVLSHDTFEAALLKPLYAGSVYLLEAPCLNYVTWSIRERRWNRGEILLAIYFWKNGFGKFMRWLQKKIQKSRFNYTKLRTESRLDFVTSYVAHSALRQMMMKPILFLYICINIGVHLKYPYLPIAVIMFLIIVFPKFAVCNRTNYKYVILETFASILQFTPEAVIGCVRLWRAFFANVSLNTKWVPHRAIEEEFKTSNPFVSSFKHLWAYSVFGIIISVIVLLYIQEAMIVMCLLITLIVLPLYTGCTTLPPSLKFFRRHKIKPSKDMTPSKNVKTFSSMYIYRSLGEIRGGYGPLNKFTGRSLQDTSTYGTRTSDLIDNTYLFGSGNKSLTSGISLPYFSNNDQPPSRQRTGTRVYLTYGYSPMRSRQSSMRSELLLNVRGLPSTKDSSTSTSCYRGELQKSYTGHSNASHIVVINDRISELLDTTYKFGQKAVLTGSSAFL